MSKWTLCEKWVGIGMGEEGGVAEEEWGELGLACKMEKKMWLKQASARAGPQPYLSSYTLILVLVSLIIHWI